MLPVDILVNNVGRRDRRDVLALKPGDLVVLTTDVGDVDRHGVVT